MVQPQKKPLLGLTADGLEVPAALCSFSQKLVGAVGREDGMLLLRAPPRLQKEENNTCLILMRLHFGMITLNFLD